MLSISRRTQNFSPEHLYYFLDLWQNENFIIKNMLAFLAYGTNIFMLLDNVWPTGPGIWNIFSAKFSNGRIVSQQEGWKFCRSIGKGIFLLAPWRQKYANITEITAIGIVWKVDLTEVWLRWFWGGPRGPCDIVRRYPRPNHIFPNTSPTISPRA